MARSVVQLAAAAYLFIVMGAGCAAIGLGPDRGPKYDLNLGKIGTGEQAITPTNNNEFWNGMPMDARTK
jgi:hypothetical protein